MSTTYDQLNGTAPVALDGEASGAQPFAAEASVAEPNERTEVPRYSGIDLDPATKRTVILLIAVAVVMAGADAVAVKATLDLELRNAPWLSWILTAGISLGAVALTHLAGYLLREAGARNWRWALRAIAAGLLLVWLAGGAGLGFLRVVSSKAASSGSGIFSGALGVGVFSHPEALAVLLGFVWLATGMVSAVTGAALHAPAHAAFNRMTKAMQATRTARGAARSALVAATATLGEKRADLARLGADLALLEAEAHNHAEFLKVWARLELARVLADPVATNALLPDPNLGGPASQLSE